MMACGGVASGMVAVVRGLPHSGLAVTLHDGTRQYTLQPDLYGAQRHSCSTSTYTNTGEASTEVVQRNFTPYRDSVAQVSDDRYTSSYQVSHCRVTPTSPPVELTEFPPQAPEPCRGYDNFVVGGTGSGRRVHSPVRVSEGNFKGGGLVWPSRGSVCMARPSREVDSFANSLRKYPNVSPDRSFDIVEKLINYTQTKNKNIVSTRSSPTRPRDSNLTAVIEELRNFRNNNTSTKNMQTYTRTVKGPIHESPTRDISGRVKLDHDDGKSKEVDYDYLAIGKERRYEPEVSNQKKGYNKTLDVRYLCDMTKSIRERIRQMCDDTECGAYTNDCPKYRDRLNDHRRKCRRDRTSHENDQAAHSPKSCAKESTICSHSERRATAVSCSPSTSECCRGKSKSAKCRARNAYRSPDSTKSLQTSVSSREYEMRSKDSYNSISDVPRTHTRSDATYPISNKINRRSKSEELVSKKPSRDRLQKELRLWLNEVPVNQYETEEERSQREDMVDILENKLFRILEDFDGEELDKEMRSEINKTLRDLPMWYPENRCEQDAFFDQMINNFIKRVQEKANGPYQNFCGSSFVVARSKMQCNICHDVFRAAIISWVNDLPLRMQSCDGRCLDKNKIVKDLDKRLRPLAQNRPNCNNMYKTILIENILDFMKEIPLRKHCCNKQDNVQRLAQKLVDLLVTIKLEQERESICCGRRGSKTGQSDNNNLEESIKEEVYDILKHAQVETTREERTEAANEISSVLMESMEEMRAGNDDEVQNKIVSILYNMHDMTAADADTIAGNIMHKAHDLSLGEGNEQGAGFSRRIESTPKYGGMSSTNGEFSDMSSIREQGRVSISNQMADQISHWLVELPLDVDASQNIDREKKDLLGRLERTIHNDDAARNEIVQWLGNMPIGREYENKKTEMADKLINRIKNLPTQSRNGRVSPKDLSYLDSLQGVISKWVDNLSIDLKSSDMKDMMVKELATEIADRQQYLEDNPSKRLNESQEDSYLEYQIYRWLFKVPTDHDHPNQLVEKFGNNVNNLIQQVKKFKSEIGLTDRIPLPYVETVQQEINNWTNQLPPDMNLDKRLKDKFSKELAEEVDRCQKQDQRGNIDNVVDQHVKNTFKRQDVSNKTSQLKDRIKNIPFRVDKPDRERPDPEKVKSHINILEKRLGEWLDLLPIQSNTSYESRKSEMVQDMAVKLKNLHAKYEDVQYENFLKDKVIEELAEFLKTVPLDPKRNGQRDREEFASMMLPVITNLSGLETFRTNDSGSTQYKPPSSPGSPYYPSMRSPQAESNRYNDISGFSANGPPGNSPQIETNRYNDMSGFSANGQPGNSPQIGTNRYNDMSGFSANGPPESSPQIGTNRYNDISGFSADVPPGRSPQIFSADIPPGVPRGSRAFDASFGTSQSAGPSNQMQRPAISNAISAWCKELPVYQAPHEMEERESTLMNFVFQLFQGVWGIVADRNVMRNDDQFRNALRVVVNQMMETLPSSPELENVKGVMAEKLVNIIIENKSGFTSHPGASGPASADVKAIKNELYNRIIAWCHEVYGLAVFPPCTNQHEIFLIQSQMIFDIFSVVFQMCDDDNIFSNKTLLEEMIGEEVLRQIEDLPKSPELDQRKREFATRLARDIVTNIDLFLEKGTQNSYQNIPDGSGQMHRHYKSVNSEGVKYFSGLKQDSSQRQPSCDGPCARRGSSGRRSQDRNAPTDYDSFASGVPANSSAIQQRTLATRSPEQQSQSLSRHTSLQSATMPTYEDTRWSSQLTPNPGSPMYVSNQRSSGSEHYTTLPDASISPSMANALRQTRPEQPSVRFTSYQGRASLNNSGSHAINDSRQFVVSNTLDKSMDHLKKMLAEEIIGWCDRLPAFRGSDPDEQTKRQHLQFALLLLVFRKAHELAANPDFFDDNDVFEELMAIEIESLLETVPDTPELQADKWMLSLDLAKKITDYKKCFERKNRTQISLMNRTEEAPGYQTFQRRVEVVSTPNAEGIQNRSVTNEVGKRAHWFSPHGEAQNASQDQNLTSTHSGIPSPILRSPQQGRNGGATCTTCREDRTTCPQRPAASTPVSGRQYEGGGQSEVKMQFRQIASDPGGATAVLERNTTRDDIEHFTISSSNPQALARLVSNVQGQQTPMMNESIQVQDHPSASGHMPQDDGNVRSLSPEDSQSMAKWMHRMGPQMGAPYSQTMPDGQSNDPRMQRPNHPRTSESMPPGYSTQMMQSNGMSPRRGRMDMSEDSASPGESRDDVGNDMRMRCKCKERAMSKCPRQRKHGVCMRPSCAFCNSTTMFTPCPQCCGFHCPHPSMLYFS